MLSEPGLPDSVSSADVASSSSRIGALRISARANGDTLSLSARQCRPGIADRRVIALRLFENELVGVGKLRRGLDFLVGRLRAAVADIVADRAFEQVRLLRDIGDGVAQRLLRHMGNVLAVDEYAALVRIVESAAAS